MTSFAEAIIIALETSTVKEPESITLTKLNTSETGSSVLTAVILDGVSSKYCPFGDQV